MNIIKRSVTELLAEKNSLLQKREAVNVAMCEIADKAKAEKRELSAEENVKYQQLQGEFSKLSREIVMNHDQINALKDAPESKKSANTLLREVLATTLERGGKAEYKLSREAVNTDALEAGGMIPLTIKDVLPPLEMGLVFDKVGIPVETGVVGDIQWPVMGGVEASIQGEGTSLADTNLDLSKINAKRVRVGISFTVSNQAITNASTDLVSLIQNQARMGLRRTLNRVTFSHENFTGDFHGPFAGAKATGSFAATVPTYKELLAMKGAVAATGVEMIGFCYVMSENMKAVLEATPIDAGSGRMIVENGMIAGYPVFCTEFINYSSSKEKAAVEYIAAGVFAYLPVNQYGDIRLIVDPYSKAKEDCVVITLNSDWSMTTLREEAFALYKTV